MQFWMTLAVPLLMVGACLVNGQEAVSKDTCEACEITCGSGSGQTTLSCKDIYDSYDADDADSGHENKAYTLHVNSEHISVYCHMVKAELEACGGGGWTLVMKINGNKDTFHYDSKLWTNKNELNPLGGETLLDHDETKLPTYWSTPFSKICLAMKTSDGEVNSIVINQNASSLYALIADGTEKLLTTNLGRHTWKKLLGNRASLQEHCNKEGFNLKSPNYHSEARIGIISNQENDCASPDSRIGFGTGGYPNGHNTCGNVASAHYHPDNGGKDIRAMGYILVQ